MATSDVFRAFRERVDRYRLQEMIGEGGMGCVFMAADERLGRRVAIKVLSDDLATASRRLRFEREVSVTTRLTHPHIVPTFDFGEIDGSLYYVMPYVEGDTLAERLATEGSLPVDQVRRTATELASALDYAHEQGVVHRDVKPSNVLLSNGGAMLSDFGVARVIDGDNADLTEAGVAVGTVRYMSPEQIDGRSVPASDQYSLACLIYEMLAGEAPYEGEDSRSIMSQHQLAPIPSVREVRPEVGTPFDAALRRAMSKVPADRFHSMQSFAEALGETGARSGGQVLTRLSEEFTGELAVAVLPFEHGTEADEASLAAGMTDALSSALSRLRLLRVASRLSVEALLRQGQDPMTLGERLGVSLLLRGALRSMGGKIRIDVDFVQAADGYNLWSESIEGSADEIFGVQERMARRVVRQLRRRLSENVSSVYIQRGTDVVGAYHRYLRGRHAWSQRSEDGFREAIAHFEAALLQDPDYALAYSGLCDCHLAFSQFQILPGNLVLPQAERAGRRAIELAPDIADVAVSWAHVCELYRWNPAEAEHYYRRAIEINPTHANAHAWLADMLLLLDRSEEAFELSAKARSLEPFSTPILNQHATLLYRSRDFDAAEQCFRTVLADSPAFLMAHLFLGFTLCELDRAGEALQRAQTLALKAPDLPIVQLAIAYSAGRAGESAIASTALDRLDGLGRRVYVPASFQVIARGGIGDVEGALPWLERSFHERSLLMIIMDHEPYMDPLRSREAFLRTRERVGFFDPAARGTATSDTTEDV